MEPKEEKELQQQLRKELSFEGWRKWDGKICKWHNPTRFPKHNMRSCPMFPDGDCEKCEEEFQLEMSELGIHHDDWEDERDNIWAEKDD